MEKNELTHRLYIYVSTLEYIEHNIFEGVYSSGICHAIKRSIYDEDPDPYYNLDLYPEIYMHKPVDFGENVYDVYWFPRDKTGTQKRIEILKSAIENIENQLQDGKRN